MSRVKDKIQFEIIKTEKVNKARFIKFWSKQYPEANQTLYENNIGRRLTEKRILELFKWKNGGGTVKAKREVHQE